MTKAIAIRTARYTFINLTMVVLVLAFGMMVHINAPKESVVRPGLAPADQAAVCAKNDAVRIECS